jgi:ABC-type Fe3+/spermidine/putrescine transport system ATPase subunit
LSDVSFDVRAGEALCILGRSGTGKSVTLKLIISLLKPDKGEIWIEQDEITRLEAPELSRVRRKMGFLFQDAALFDSLTLYENLALPLFRLSDKSPQEVVWVIKISSMSRIDRFSKVSKRLSSRLSSIGRMITFLSATLTYLRAFLVSRHNLALEAAALRQQLTVFKRKQPRSRLHRFDRLFWIALRRLVDGLGRCPGSGETGHRSLLASRRLSDCSGAGGLAQVGPGGRKWGNRSGN